MATKALSDGFHLSLSIGQSLWTDFLGQALPVKVGEGNYRMTTVVKGALAASSVQVKGLLAGVGEQVRANPTMRAAVENPVVVRAKERAVTLWDNRKDDVYAFLERLVEIEGTWRVDVEKQGTGFAYSEQALTANVRVKLGTRGMARLMEGQYNVPYSIDHSIGATVTLGDVAFDREARNLTASLRDVHLHVGDSAPGRLLQYAVDRALETQLERINPLVLVKREQLENLISPGSTGPLRLSAGISDLHVGIDDENVTLSLRFNFQGEN